MKVGILLLCFVGIVLSYEFTVYYDKESKSMSVGPFKTNYDALAHGKCEFTLDVDGSHHFDIHTNPNYDDELQMEAIGYADGHCFQEQIYHHFFNVKTFFMHNYLNGSDFHNNVYKFLYDNQEYTRSEMKKHDTPFWKQVRLVINQFDGLVKGYAQRAPAGQDLSAELLWFYQSFGECLDLKNKFVLEALKPDPVAYKKYLNELEWTWADHCSASVKVAKDNSDIYIAQDAWFSYTALNRVSKTYEFHLKESSTKITKLTFSSYPGFVYSFDDFMVSDQKIVHFETTNNIYKPELYDKVLPESIMTWIRNRVAIQGASNGKEWVDLFEQQNSGTYNNQWQILDYKLFTPHKPIPDGTLYMLEQIPGYCEKGDVTKRLRDLSYFPSYNVPYFETVYNMSGYPEAQKDTPGHRYYDECPRAKLFDKLHKNADDFTGFKKMMRHNNYKIDPESQSEPGNAIMSRYDLRTTNAKCFGGLDTKVANKALVEKNAMEIITSPAFGDSDIEAFDFEKDNYKLCIKKFQRKGLPNHWDFPWVKYEAETHYGKKSDDSGLTPGQKAAIIVTACVCGVVLIGLLLFFWRRYRSIPKETYEQPLISTTINGDSV